MSESDPYLLSRRGLLVGAAGTLALLACDGGGDDPDAGRTASDGGPPVDDAGTLTDAGSADTGPTPDGGGSSSCSNLTFEMGDAHPAGFRHNLVIGLADVTAGVDKTYDIQGESPQPHTLVVTAAHFATLAGGGSVVIDSTEDMGIDLHDHAVTIHCS